MVTLRLLPVIVGASTFYACSSLDSWPDKKKVASDENKSATSDAAGANQDGADAHPVGPTDGFLECLSEPRNGGIDFDAQRGFLFVVGDASDDYLFVTSGEQEGEVRAAWLTAIAPIYPHLEGQVALNRPNDAAADLMPMTKAFQAVNRVVVCGYAGRDRVHVHLGARGVFAASEGVHIDGGLGDNNLTISVTLPTDSPQSETDHTTIDDHSDPGVTKITAGGKTMSVFVRQFAK